MPAVGDHPSEVEIREGHNHGILGLRVNQSHLKGRELCVKRAGRQQGKGVLPRLKRGCL